MTDPTATREVPNWLDLDQAISPETREAMAALVSEGETLAQTVDDFCRRAHEAAHRYEDEKEANDAREISDALTVATPYDDLGRVLGRMGDSIGCVFSAKSLGLMHGDTPTWNRPFEWEKRLRASEKRWEERQAASAEADGSGE